MKEIDLAHKDGCCGPVACCPPDAKPSEPSYPGAYLTLPEGSELPDSGEITFRFRVRRETEEKTGDKKCTYDLDLMAIVGAKADKSEDDGEDDNAAERIEKAFKGKKKY